MGLLGLLRLRRAVRAGVPGRRRASRARIVHPQHWPEDLDYAGKKVVVIGSGATAVTLVPAMAGTAGHVTMLQRSPSYISQPAGPRPARDRAATGCRPGCRTRSSAGPTSCSPSAPTRSPRRWPDVMQGAHPQGRRRRSCPTTSTSTCTSSRRYDPWDQRLCFVPGRRPVPRAAQGPGLDRHRHDRDVHADRHPAHLGPGARGRHHRHRDRAAAAGVRRRSTSSSTASRSTCSRPWPTRR